MSTTYLDWTGMGFGLSITKPRPDSKLANILESRPGPKQAVPCLGPSLPGPWASQAKIIWLESEVIWDLGPMAWHALHYEGRPDWFDPQSILINAIDCQTCLYRTPSLGLAKFDLLTGPMSAPHLTWIIQHLSYTGQSHVRKIWHSIKWVKTGSACITQTRLLRLTCIAKFNWTVLVGTDLHNFTTQPTFFFPLWHNLHTLSMSLTIWTTTKDKTRVKGLLIGLTMNKLLLLFFFQVTYYMNLSSISYFIQLLSFHGPFFLVFK